ncbi:MAG: peptidylprolyl isomerase [Candidatus Dasytiphilus stammeri]
MKKFIILIISINFITSLPSIAATQIINRIAAIVNDQVILQSEIEDRINLIKHNHKNETLLFPESDLRSKIIEDLINNQILYNLGKMKHLSVAQEQINLTIKSKAATQNMTLAQFYKQIMTHDTNYHQYRATLSKELITKEVYNNIIHNSVNITPSEITGLINQMKNNDFSEINLTNIIIPLSKHPTNQQESQARLLVTQIIYKIKNHKNIDILNNIIIFKNQKVCGRQIKDIPNILLKNLNNKDLIGPIRSNRGFHIFKINEITNKIIFITDIHLRHILLKLSNRIDDKQAIKIMKQITNKIKTGKIDFTSAAKYFSQDTISAPLGGDLGWNSPNILGYKLSTGLLKLKNNEISLPVRSPMGWHLIQLLGSRKVDKTNIIFQEQALHILYMRKLVEAVKLWTKEQQQLKNSSYVKILGKGAK